MTLFTEIKVICPKCKKHFEETISVSEPNFSAEKMKDSASEFWESLICPNCEYEIEYYGSNSFYELYLDADELDEDSFIYSQPEYDFAEYEIDEEIENDGVEAILEKREISSLYHFTKIDNLKSIFDNGIIPRSSLEAGSFSYTDKFRGDGFLDANCVSISFPQYKMFYRKRGENVSQDWVVIEISTDTVLEKECAFFERNAASREVKKEIIENRKTSTAFEKMFADIEEFPPRADTKLLDKFPTDPQAEILVFGKIEPNLIEAFHFENESILNGFKKSINGIECRVTPELFDTREDSEF